MRQNINNNSGFSLIEILVVTSILVILSVLMIFNFRAAATNASSRHQVAASIVADIRGLQAKALAGISSTGIIVCGYGIHFSNPLAYLIFVRQTDASGVCSSDARTLGADPNDQILESKTIGNPNFAIQTSAGFANSDIYFQPPDPTTYINDQKIVAGANEPSEDILIVRSNDPSDTASSKITVYASGKIDIIDMP